MNRMKQIDPASNTVIVGGAIISGFSDGEMIGWVPDADWYAKHVGGDGDVTRVATNDHTGKLTLTLDQASDSNDVLSALLLGGAIVPVMVKDTKGRTVISTTSAWSQKPAEVKISKGKSEPRVWVLDMGQVEGLLVGGN